MATRHVALVAVLFFIFQRNTPQDVGLPAVEPEPDMSAEEIAAEKRISIWAPLNESGGADQAFGQDHDPGHA